MSSSHAFTDDNAITAKNDDRNDFSDGNDNISNGTMRTEANNVNSTSSNSVSNVNATRRTNHISDTNASIVGVDEDPSECDNEKIDAI